MIFDTQCIIHLKNTVSNRVTKFMVLLWKMGRQDPEMLYCIVLQQVPPPYCMYYVLQYLMNHMYQVCRARRTQTYCSTSQLYFQICSGLQKAPCHLWCLPAAQNLRTNCACLGCRIIHYTNRITSKMKYCRSRRFKSGLEPDFLKL